MLPSFDSAKPVSFHYSGDEIVSGKNLVLILLLLRSTCMCMYMYSILACKYVLLKSPPSPLIAAKLLRLQVKCVLNRLILVAVGAYSVHCELCYAFNGKFNKY